MLRLNKRLFSTFSKECLSKEDHELISSLHKNGLNILISKTNTWKSHHRNYAIIQNLTDKALECKDLDGRKIGSLKALKHEIDYASSANDKFILELNKRHNSDWLNELVTKWGYKTESTTNGNLVIKSD